MLKPDSLLSSNLIITPLNRRDSDLMAALYKVCFPEPWKIPWTSSFFAETFAQTTAHEQNGILARHPGYGIFTHQPLLGFILGHVVDHEAEILTLCVDPLARRHGLGKKLLQHFLQSHKSTSCFLEVNASNQAAINLYTGFGSKKVTMRKGYYRTPRIHLHGTVPSDHCMDAWVMKLGGAS